MRRTPSPTCTRAFAVVLVSAVMGSLAVAGPTVAAHATDATADGSPSTVSDFYYQRRDAVAPLRSRSYSRLVKRTRSANSAPAPTTTPTPASIPAGAVHVAPGEDLAAVVAAHPAGTAFLLLSGVHRLQAISPKDGSTFVGEPGAVLNGARLLTGFTASGGAWFVGGQTQEGPRQGTCRIEVPLCNHPDRVFVDELALTPVASRAELRPGTYFFDYAADRIWLGGDPTGRRVEAAVKRAAFGGTATGVTIRSLIVEKYASPAQRGAIDVYDGHGWLIESVTARLNASGGIRVGERTTVRNSRAVDNGQIGILGMGTGIVIQGNEIARNNTAGFSEKWEAGGTKFVLTDGLLVAANTVHHNDGPGLWTDIDNKNTTYVNNLVEDNAGEGIFHEISGSAVIRGNRVRRNGRNWHPWVWGAGIQVASSFDVEIYGNLVEDNGNGIVGNQQDRGSGRNGPRLLRNLHVHDNVIRASGVVGVGQDVRDRSIFTDRQIRFQSNTYDSTQVFSWMDEHMNGTRWRSYGHDVPAGAP